MQDSGILERIADSARASRSELGLMALVGIAIVGACVVVVVRTSDPPAPPITREVAAMTATPESSPASEPKTLLVHVAGQVRHPGVYELPEGSRINDAVAAAGGPLEGADGNHINLAAAVTDGQKITLAKPGEAPPSEEGTSASNGSPSGAKINLNTASQAQLEELPSVGPVLAQRIIAHRQKEKFTNVRQLMEVSGVGPKTFEALKDLVTV